MEQLVDMIVWLILLYKCKMYNHQIKCLVEAKMKNN